RELFVLDRLREIATYRQALVFPIDSIASACHALGEIGIADFISLGILYREIENTQNSRILRASTEAIVKLLSLVLEKELSPYVRP
ncbi:MAG: hypothetical protein NC920_04945, partial [Candidatus Omnitrophica bacterium]|nr:hypothetical protein [Candidatus Omnitrophota bacterium]